MGIWRGGDLRYGIVEWSGCVVEEEGRRGERFWCKWGRS